MLHTTLFQYSLDALGIVDLPSGRIVDCNLATCELLARPREALIERPLSDFLDRDDRSAERALAFDLRRVDSGEAVTSEYRLPGDRYLELKLNRFDTEGRTLCLFAGRDVTAAVVARRNLEYTTRRLEVALESTASGIWELDLRDGTVLWYGDIESIVGLERGGFKGTLEGYIELVHPQDREGVSSAIEEALADAHGGYHVEHRVIRPDGSECWVEGRGRVIRGDDDEPVRIVGTVWDVTERRRTESMARQSRFSLDNAPDAIFWVAPDGSFTYVNEAACRALGFSREELLGTPLFDVAPNRTIDAWEGFWEQARSEKSRRYETVMRTRDGRLIPFDLNLTFGVFEGQEYLFTVARDIAEQKEAEAEVGRTASLLQAAITRSPAGIMIVDADGVILHHNQTALVSPRMRGRDLLGAKVQDLYDVPVFLPDGRPCPPSEYPLARALRAGETTQRELIIREDGVERSFLVHAAPIQGNDGAIAGAILVMSDITAHKQVTEELRMARHSLEASSTVIFWVRPDGSLLYANDAACDLLGYPREELLKKSVPDFDRYYTAERWESGELWRDFRQAGVTTFESLLFAYDGREIPVEITANYVSFEDREYLFAFAADISGRKAVQQQLAESEEKFRKAFDQSPDTIVISHIDTGLIVDVNAGFERMFGISRADAIGKSTVDLGVWSDPHDRRKLAEAIRREGRVREIEVVGNGADGPMTTLFSAETFELGGEQWVVSVTRDITRRKRDEQALHRSREQLRRLAGQLTTVEERERRQLASFLHDQIGQTLAVLRLRVGGLVEPGDNDSFLSAVADIRELLDEAIDDTRRVTSDLSPPVLYELGLGAAVGWLGERLSREHGLAFEFNGREDDAGLDADTRAQIFRCARELMHNVVKHARATSVTADVAVDGDDLCVLVEDDGVGFDPGKVFDVPADCFGLVSIRERMRYIGGRLEVESAPGQGTRCTLVVPIEVSAGQKAGGATP